MWGHTGTIPGYKNWAGYSPSENITIVISYNATFAKPMDLAVRLMNIYLKAVSASSWTDNAVTTEPVCGAR